MASKVLKELEELRSMLAQPTPSLMTGSPAVTAAAAAGLAGVGPFSASPLLLPSATAHTTPLNSSYSNSFTTPIAGAAPYTTPFTAPYSAAAPYTAPYASAAAAYSTAAAAGVASPGKVGMYGAGAAGIGGSSRTAEVGLGGISWLTYVLCWHTSRASTHTSLQGR